MIVDAVQAVSVSALIRGNTILGKRPIVLGRRAKSQYNEQHSTNLALKKISLKKNETKVFLLIILAWVTWLNVKSDPKEPSA